MSEQIATEYKSEWRLPKTLECVAVRMQEHRRELSLYLQSFFARIPVLPPVKRIVFEVQSPFPLAPNLEKVSDVIGNLRYSDSIERLNVVIENIGSIAAINNREDVTCNRYNYKARLSPFHEPFVLDIAETEEERFASLTLKT